MSQNDLETRLSQQAISPHVQQPPPPISMQSALHHHHQQQQQQQPPQQPGPIQLQLQPMLSNNPPQRKGSSQRHCKTEGHTVSATVCANCGTTTTPLWRRAPNGETICNACGLYYKARNTVRPPWLKRNAIKKAAPTSTENSDAGTCPGDGHCDGTGGSSSCNGCPAFNQHQVNRQALVCANCGTNTTPLWRRDESGNTICNACGLYFKLHNVSRPVTMKRSVIKRRKRVALATSPPAHHHHHHHHHNNGNSDESDHQQRGNKNRAVVIQHPPTPSSSSGSDHDYASSEDDVSSIDDVAIAVTGSRKRKVEDEPIGNKRHCRGNVPAIEDYILRPKRNSFGGHWHSQHDHEERHNSLSPVEPVLNTLPQVQIHQYSGHSMGTPSVPLPAVYSSNAGPYNDGAASPSHSGSAPGTPPPISGISALLNPGSPSSKHPQLPPLSSVGVSHAGPFTSMPGMSTTQSQNQTRDNRGENITTILQAHRQELQREVSHLTMLLNRTNAVLSNIDQAMASVTQGNGNADSPPAESYP